FPGPGVIVGGDPDLGLRCDELVPFTNDQRAIILYGNLDAGFEAFGPFSSRAEADLKRDDQLIMTLVEPYGVEPAPDDPHVVLWGSLRTGYMAIGPFHGFDEADEWAGGLNGPTWIMPLESPSSSGEDHEF